MATASDAGAAAKMASYLSRLNPVPGFPDYTGPYKVGTVDVEIPVSQLGSPSPAPANAADIHTVQFRIFYPATPDSAGKGISWLPSPQRSHISAYTKFLGLGPILAEIVSFLPRHLNYTTIPVIKNASLLEADTPSKQWPTMIFSHGLGGNRNAYSHVVGSLASHGVVVICPEHRDGSSAVSFIRDPAAQDSFFKRSTRSVVPYVRIPHTETAEVWDARTQQFKIRMWELGLIHEAVLSIQEDATLTNMNTSTPTASLAQFKGKLNVEEPGSIIWGGHSFGASSLVQFLKTTYYADDPQVSSMAEPLFTPAPNSRIRAQVTEKSLTILLDMWCFPLLASSSRRLWELPLPMYADKPSAAGGKALMAIESESFFKWTAHLHTTAKIISPEPSAPAVAPGSFERPSGVRLSEPNFFYVQNSAHLNQSDFGLLFPWLTRRVFGAEEPERALRLNVRAILQMLRVNHVPVARTWAGDLVDGAHVDKLGAEEGIDDDKAIFDRSGADRIKAWRWIDVVGLGPKAGELQKLEGQDGDGETKEADNGEEQMEGELEPHLSPQTSRTTAPLAAAVAAG